MVQPRKPLFAGLRVWLADRILGGQTVLFVSKEQEKLLREQRFLEIDDTSLGTQFRRWCQLFGEFVKARADEEGQTFRFAMTSQSVLFLATELSRRNAEEAEFITRGTIDGGRTQGCYRIRIDKMPDDYAIGEEPVEISYSENEPDKITKIVLREDNPGYSEWLAKTSTSRSASQA